jgi:DNA mismatch repair ATPase MutS
MKHDTEMASIGNQNELLQKLSEYLKHNENAVMARTRISSKRKGRKLVDEARKEVETITELSDNLMALGYFQTYQTTREDREDKRSTLGIPDEVDGLGFLVSEVSFSGIRAG